MIQNAIAMAIILGWVCGTIYLMVRDYRKAKREGTPMACFSCGAFQTGSCNHRCPTEKDVDRMIAAARERLAQKAARTEQPL